MANNSNKKNNRNNNYDEGNNLSGRVVGNALRNYIIRDRIALGSSHPLSTELRWELQQMQGKTTVWHVKGEGPVRVTVRGNKLVRSNGKTVKYIDALLIMKLARHFDLPFPGD